MKASKRWLIQALLSAAVALPWVTAHAADNSAPDLLIRQLSQETLDAVRTDKAIQAGDVGRVMTMVDAKVMPHVNFQRMTASAVGRFWRQATPEQRQRLQDEFKTLLLRTYSGALAQVKDQQVALKPLRASPEDKEVVVKTEVRGKGEPIQLDYRLEKSEQGWRIYDMNVLGIWLADQYRNSFAQEINAKGIDGLIKSLAERNQKAAQTKS
ncbi:phospholipid-binding protein MlaC [Roseateles sp. BYS180W]|uniref:Phospholipid-binding protein MlaC n=1 Tax=Roseateles rivi TaxID=3299028 RepID=A0ABW7FRN5_9BURK